MRWIALIAAFAGAACYDDSFVVEIGIIKEGNRTSIHVPATAVRGEPFLVRVGSWGGCIEPAFTDVEYVSDVAIVTPYDRRSTTCKILKLCVSPHEAEVTFASAGNKTILFRGRTSASNTDVLEDVITTVLVE